MVEHRPRDRLRQHVLRRRRPRGAVEAPPPPPRATGPGGRAQGGGGGARGRRAPAAERERALKLREAIRDLLSAHNGLEADVARATAVLDGAAARAGLAVRLAEGRARAPPPPGRRRRR